MEFDPKSAITEETTTVNDDEPDVVYAESNHEKFYIEYYNERPFTKYTSGNPEKIVVKGPLIEDKEFTELSDKQIEELQEIGWSYLEFGEE